MNGSSAGNNQEVKNAIEELTGQCLNLVGHTQEDEVKIAEIIEIVEYNWGGYEIKQKAEGRKQYVNLDNQMIPNEAHPEYGRIIQLKARIEWVAGDSSRPLNGKKLNWYFEKGADNSTNLGLTEKACFDAPGGTANKWVETGEDGWTPVVKFCFSIYGGDKFNITVGGEAENTMQTGDYTVWRKLWFEVDTMKKRGGGLLDMDHPRLPALFEPCFIELVLEGTDNQPDNTWNLQTSELHDFANDYFGAQLSPFQSHEAAVDHQADKKTGQVKVISMTATVYTDGTSDTYYVYDGGNSWLENAEYDAGSGWKDLDKSKVSLVGADIVEKQIEIDMSSGPVTPTNADPVKVKLKYTLAEEWSGDGSNKPHAMVAMGYWYDKHPAATALKRTLGTMAHELGHLLGMVPIGSTTHIDTGTGDHCTDTDCVMYYQNTSTRTNNFCDVCKEYLRINDLTQFKTAFTHSIGASA